MLASYRGLRWIAVLGFAAGGCYPMYSITEPTTGTTDVTDTSTSETPTTGAVSSTGVAPELDCMVPFAAPLERICDTVDEDQLCFDRYQLPRSSSSPYNFAIVDLNHDDRGEVLIQESVPDLFRIVVSDPACGLIEGDPLVIEPHVLSHSFLVFDADEDGEQDILVKFLGTSYDVHALLYRGDGEGHFPPASADAIGIQPQTREFDAFADLDGDGHLDILAHEPNSLRVYRGDGHGNFAPEPGIALNGDIYSAGTLDFDEDGILDIVTGRTTVIDDALEKEELILMFGDHKTGYPKVNVYDDTSKFYSFASADMNADGHVDIFASGTIYYGGGAEHVSDRLRLEVSNINSVLGDMNGDGAPDIVSPDGIRVNRGEHFEWKFQSWSMAIGALGDLNGDGLLDVVGVSLDAEDVQKKTIEILLAVPA